MSVAYQRAIDGVNERVVNISILHVGPVSGTSLDRINAMRRLGYSVDELDLRCLLPSTVWVDRVIWRLGGRWLSPWILRRLPQRLAGRKYDVCWVDGGELVTPSVLRLLRRHVRKVVSYTIDDPLGPRDGARSSAYRQSIALYDLCVVVRGENVAEARGMGARDLMHMYRSADELMHAPRRLTPQDIDSWQCDVLFIGTWMPERGPFLLRLVQLKVPLTIRGDNWHKAPEWDALRPHWKSAALYGDDYAKAIQCARITLGLLSKGNRDLHTTRSLEIPALGGLLCAERTSEHTALYDEDKEALFFDSADECAAICHRALADEGSRSGIAAAGRVRAQRNGHFNEQVVVKVLGRLSLPDHPGEQP